jgi:hypothetical protein
MVERRLHDKVQMGTVLLPRDRWARLAKPRSGRKLLNEFRRGFL